MRRQSNSVPRLIAAVIAGLLGSCFVALPSGAQAPAPSQQTPADQKNAPKPAESNPFPDDTSNVPVMPNTNAPAIPDTSGNEAPALPASDADPVRSPDQPLADSTSNSSDSSSSLSGIDRSLLRPPDDEKPTNGKRGKQQAPAEHQETAAEDENVGNYYLSKHNWKAALSRYQSAMVLDPDNPEVYWGMAEAQYHLGDYASAKANYEKVALYDPDSKHGKDARKMLKEPEIMNARSAAPVAPGSSPR